MRLFLSLLLIIPSLAFAAVPSAGPNGENAGGLFSVYFQNMTSTSCASGEAITGFSVSATTYLRPTCQPIVSSLAWSLSGNTITPGQYIGTNNSVSLIFRTNASSDTSTKMIITTTGAVGIGTDAPSTALDVNGVTRAISFTDTTNGTWFPWTTTGFNYIRGTTYFSGFLVDEQNINFYINPAQVSVMSGLAISGVITGPTPVAPTQLTTKAYVDAAIANINAAPGAGTVYQEFHGWTVGSCPTGWTYIAGGPIYGEGAGPTVVCGIANTGIVYREFGSDNNEPCPTGWAYVGVGPKYGPGKSNIVCGIGNNAALPTPPVNAACSTTVNTCTVGTASNYIAGSCGGNATWTCNGSNGGNNANCSVANAACNTPACDRSYGENGGTCYCAGISNGPVWGSSPYTNDSDVCRAAQHVGISLPSNVTVIAGSSCSNFIGSTRNGITTADYASPWATYRFQGYGAQTCGGGGGTNGSCGSSANTCNAGSPSGYSAGSCGGSQTWTCNGSSGGASVNCSIANSACVSAGTSCRTPGGTTVSPGQAITMYRSLIDSPLCHGQSATCDGTSGLLTSSSPYGSQSSFGSAMSFSFSYGWLTMNETTCRQNYCNTSSTLAPSTGVTANQFADTTSNQSYYCSNGTTWASLGAGTGGIPSSGCAIGSGKYLYNGGCASANNRIYYCNVGTLVSTAAGTYDQYTKHCR